jgi:outer membrane protein OmpA-like peptidoglycan-associated protein
MIYCLVFAGIFALTGCASDDTVPAGSAFSQALYKNYSDLAAQTAAIPGAPEEGEDFFDNPFGLFGSQNPNDPLITAYTDKASLAQEGQEPAPEAASGDPVVQGLRARLVRGIAAGKDQFPDQSARAQADYDCWVLDSTVPTMATAAQACKTALDGSLLALENATHPAPPPPPPVAAAPSSPPPPSGSFTAYFDFDSWTLTAEDLTVLTNVINTARAGGQSHISVVGHTDTSGSAAYNQRLSVRRANVVVEALVDMGARRAAIQASGVGETDLAVQTPDGVKEAKNRRAVIDLTP